MTRFSGGEKGLTTLKGMMVIDMPEWASAGNDGLSAGAGNDTAYWAASGSDTLSGLAAMMCSNGEGGKRIC